MSVHYHENSAEQMVYVLHAVCDCIHTTVLSGQYDLLYTRNILKKGTIVSDRAFTFV